MATVAIASVVMLVLISFLSVVSNVFVASAIESEGRLMMSSTKGYLQNQLTYVTDVKNTGDASYNKLEFKDGRIYKNGVQVFENSFYGNTSVYGEVLGLGSLLTFVIRVENGTTVRSETYVVKTLNKVDTAISTPVKVLYYK